jgi:hypothetical protein
MYTKVVAMDSVAFEQWFQNISRTQNRPYLTLLARGLSPN